MLMLTSRWHKSTVDHRKILCLRIELASESSWRRGLRSWPIHIMTVDQNITSSYCGWTWGMSTMDDQKHWKRSWLAATNTLSPISGEEFSQTQTLQSFLSFLVRCDGTSQGPWIVTVAVFALILKAIQNCFHTSKPQLRTRIFANCS